MVTDVHALLVQALTEARITSHTFTAEDGHLAVSVHNDHEAAEIATNVLLSLPGVAILDIADFQKQLRSHSYDLGFGKLIKLDYIDDIITQADQLANRAE